MVLYSIHLDKACFCDLFHLKKVRISFWLDLFTVGVRILHRPRTVPYLRFSCTVLTVSRPPYRFPFKTAKPRTEPFKTEFHTHILL